MLAFYFSAYSVLRLTKSFVHGYGWEYDPVGAGEPWAPARHRIDYFQRYSMSDSKEITVKSVISVVFKPLGFLEVAYWNLVKPKVFRNDQDLKRHYGYK